MTNFYDRSQLLFTRFDKYYESVNTKGIFYLTINTFFIGVFLSCIKDINEHFILTHAIRILFALFILGCFSAICLTLLAINPFLDSGKTTGRAESILFYKSISRYESADFISRMKTIEEDDIVNDIGKQLHTLATGLSAKYAKLKIVGYIIFAEFVLLIPILILLITNLR